MPEFELGAWSWGGDVMQTALAGGARQCVTFLDWPRKVTKRRPPRFRRNPGSLAFAWGSERTRFAQTPFAGLRQPQSNPKLPTPAEGENTVAHHRFSSPLSRQFFRGRSGEVGEHCLSPAGASCAAARTGLEKLGTRRATKRGVLSLVTFFAQAKKVMRRRAPPAKHLYPTNTPAFLVQ
jgi:hypothetical protein